MLRRSAERTMQAMVAACFSRLRHLNPETSEGFAAFDLASSSASISENDPDAAQGGPRMVAPDPRSAQIPAAGAEHQKGPQQHLDEVLDDKVVERLEQEAEKLSPTGMCSLTQLDSKRILKHRPSIRGIRHRNHSIRSRIGSRTPESPHLASQSSRSATYRLYASNGSRSFEYRFRSWRSKYG